MGDTAAALMCKSFFYSEDRPEPDVVYDNIHPTELFDLLVPAANLIHEPTVAKLNERQNVVDHVEEFMSRHCPWDFHRSYQDNAVAVCHAWLFITATCKEVDRVLLNHETLGDTSQKQLDRSLKQARMGLIPFMISSVIHGAGKKSTMKKSLAQQTMTSMQRFAFALPLIQVLFFDGDAFECLKDYTWKDMYEGQDVHGWLKHIQELARINIWSETKLKRHCIRNSPNYLTGPDILEKCAGLRFEIALVVSYFRPDFVIPKEDAKLFLTTAEKEQLLEKRIPNVERNGEFLEQLFRSRVGGENKPRKRVKRVRSIVRG